MVEIISFQPSFTLNAHELSQLVFFPFERSKWSIYSNLTHFLGERTARVMSKQPFDGLYASSWLQYEY